jgi:hypothetical protein
MASVWPLPLRLFFWMTFRPMDDGGNRYAMFDLCGGLPPQEAADLVHRGELTFGRRARRSSRLLLAYPRQSGANSGAKFRRRATIDRLRLAVVLLPWKRPGSNLQTSFSA